MSAVTKPFKELGQEVAKVATTVGTAGTVRYDEDEGFKEGFVTKTAVREGSKALGNVVNLASNVTQQNPELANLAGAYFGIPNASQFLDRKEEMPTTSPTVVTAPVAPNQNNNNMIILIGGVVVAIMIFIFMGRKK